MWAKCAAVIIGLTGFTVVVQSHTHMPEEGDIVVGSYAVDVDGVPYFVSIEKSSGSKQCGGAIISEGWVLTTAHCTDDSKIPRHYRVRAGSNYRNKQGYVYLVDLIKIHKNYQYNQGTPINDIALMHVVVPIEFERNRAFIDIFEQNELIPFGAKGFVISWDEERYKIDPAATNLPQLYYIPILSLSINQCRSRYWDRTHMADRGQVCVAYAGLTPDICDGDSGAALVINGKLAGLYSWGCEDAKQLGVYTEIAHYRPWIRKITGV